MRKMPFFKRKNLLICSVELKAGAGTIKQTGTPTHHTWWPFADYPILEGCAVEIE
jgi:hypothetical protein